MSTEAEEHPFWIAVANRAVEDARSFLEKEPSLASHDFRSDDAKQKDPYDTRYPLIKASFNGDLAMVALLLDHGADIDARSPTEDQRGHGWPIMAAVEHKHYDLAHLLLDRGASLDAHGYCSASLAEELHEAARKAGAPQELARKGFERYIGEQALPDLGVEPPAVVALFARVLEMGAKLSLGSIVLDGDRTLAEALLRKAPTEPGTPHDHPQGTVFENLCNAGSWHGHPWVLELAMRLCPELYSRASAEKAIRRAIVSHNREGTVDDYEALIEAQLVYLTDQGALESVIAEGALLPHFLLAKDYLWKGWCGPESSPSTADSMIRLSELLIRHGFTDLNRTDSESGKTALSQALDRCDGHPGLDQYVDYLKSRGATA